jgi:rare lipoprotein A
MLGAAGRGLGLAVLLVWLQACSAPAQSPSDSWWPGRLPSDASAKTRRADRPAAAQPSASERYHGKPNDWGPEQEIDMSHVPDAVPRYEVRTIAGNKNPYTILGKTYRLMPDERAYSERGLASWYGFKFNGERTSNGEVYDMFAMTGAHKTLPIPSYVRVTNLDNRTSVIVRINDRGPFHAGRIVDLSYAAAQRLGITRAGTGRVEVEIVVPEGDPRPPLLARHQTKTARKSDPLARAAGIVAPVEAGAKSAESKLPDGTYLQIAAFGVEKSAKQFAASIKGKLSFPVVISAVKSPSALYRVRLGPFKDVHSIQTARAELEKIAISEVHLVDQ